MKYVWIVATTREDGSYDSILNNTAYPTKDECKKAVKKAREEDRAKGWGYIYSNPQEIKVEE